MKKISQEKVKALNVILGVFFYIFAPVFFIIFFKYHHLYRSLSIILAYRKELFQAFRYFLPILIILVPIIVKIFYKTNFYKAVIIGLIFLVLYIPYILLMERIVVHDVSSFSPKKWSEHVYLRGFMVKDLNNRYDIKGKNTKDIKSMLGNPNKKEENKWCYVIDFEKEYCLVFNDKKKVEGTSIN